MTRMGFGNGLDLGCGIGIGLVVAFMAVPLLLLFGVLIAGGVLVGAVTSSPSTDAPAVVTAPQPAYSTPALDAVRAAAGREPEPQAKPAPEPEPPAAPRYERVGVREEDGTVTLKIIRID